MNDDCHSAVDSFEPESNQRYPLSTRAKFIEFDLLPGDMLFIPTGWFHQVRLIQVFLFQRVISFFFTPEVNCRTIEHRRPSASIAAATAS